MSGAGAGGREPGARPGGGSVPRPSIPARTILHVDMDAFFAAVEVREDPSLAGLPVVVGADPDRGRGRGVVAAASYEARRYGIHSAMPISEAWRRCPGARWLRPRMALYSEVSRRIFEVFSRYTELVEPLSLDEAFLDVTGSRALFGDGPEIARRIKREIREGEGLSASVGVAASKYVAKVASDLEKPDGLVVVPPGEEAAFLAPLEVGRLWGAGPKARERFARLGLRTIGDVAAAGERRLTGAFGEATGRRFHELARGIDARPVDPDRVRKSMGRETTFPEDVADRERVGKALLDLCEQVAARLRRRGLAGSTVALKLRWEGFETVTRQATLRTPVDTTERIWPVARRLLADADRPERRIRLVGVSVSGLDSSAAVQLSLFSAGEPPADARVAEAIDRLTERFGEGAVTRAAILARRERSEAAHEGPRGPDGGSAGAAPEDGAGR